MKKKTNFPEYLYQATNRINLESIIEKKLLVPIGKRINGYDENTISLSDILTDYTPFYGDVVLEFKADNLFKKNKIYPRRYEINENGPEFLEMPFWEAEWRAKMVKFSYSDINMVYFLAEPLLSNIGLLRDKNISFGIIYEKKLPSYPEIYLIERYREQIKMLDSLEVN
jgi:hypothetical protein